MAGTVTGNERNVACSAERTADIHGRLRALCSTAPSELPAVRRSAWPDRDGQSMDRPQSRCAAAAERGRRDHRGGRPVLRERRLNTIADDLHPPPTREIRAALETRLTDRLVLRLGGTDRRQHDLIQPVNSAYRPANYSVTYVADPGLNSLGPDDDQMLPVFNRLPVSFGTDSYVLRNVDDNTAMDHGLDLVLERVFDGRWGMVIGATAHKSNGTGGNRGFRPDENDQGVLGEVFSDPNASTMRAGGCSSSAVT